MKRKHKFNIVIKKNLLIIFLLFIVYCIYIDTSYAASQSDTVVSDIVTKFHSELSKYESVMLKYAKSIFYWCAVLEIAWFGVKKALGASDIGETLREFCFIIFATGFFLAVINNYHTWTWNIINGLKSIASEATVIIDVSCIYISRYGNTFLLCTYYDANNSYQVRVYRCYVCIIHSSWSRRNIILS